MREASVCESKRGSHRICAGRNHEIAGCIASGRICEAASASRIASDLRFVIPGPKVHGHAEAGHAHLGGAVEAVAGVLGEELARCHADQVHDRRERCVDIAQGGQSRRGCGRC
eukprot:9984578-Alexandrium_andersonii.AAC.1